jgi:acyl-coenzyme A thioesterase PaaI-like protein
MTDLLDGNVSLPNRLGLNAELHDDDELQMQLRPRPHVLRHGAVRVSVLALMIDVAAGIVVDDDPDVWTFTSDMSVRMRPLTTPESIHTRTTILRRGNRSATAVVDLVGSKGEPVAVGAIGFAKVRRREADPPKPQSSVQRIMAMFDGSSLLSQPLREEAGIRVLDPMQGVVEMELTPGLRNPAGTLQGAMVALLAEAAAEELMSSRFEIPAVVTDLDLRYLAQTGAGPVRTRCRLLGQGADSPIQVELFDTSNDRLTTLVYARTAIIAQ